MEQAFALNRPLIWIHLYEAFITTAVNKNDWKYQQFGFMALGEKMWIQDSIYVQCAFYANECSSGTNSYYIKAMQKKAPTIKFIAQP